MTGLDLIGLSGGIILFAFMISASPYVIMWCLNLWLDLIDIDFWVDLVYEVFGGDA